MTLPSTDLHPGHAGQAWYGLHPATVVGLEDPSGAQRVQVEFPWLPTADLSSAVRAWAEIVTPYADADQGLMMLPEIGSTVVVGFWWGDLDHPYIIGATWNGNAQMPESPTDDNNLRVIVTRSGSRLEFDDTDGAVKVRISSGGAPGAGVNTITLDDAGRSISIDSASGARVTLTSAGDVDVQASRVTVNAAMVSVTAPMSDFSGIVKCDTLIASGGGVISPSYTPGAGNVW